MIFVLSKNYYKSNPCLNEMGASWLTAKKSDILLLPGFGFSDFKKQDGCLNSDIQAGSIDSDDEYLKAWLSNLRDDIVNELKIERPNDLDWEYYRDLFIRKMKEIIPNKTDSAHYKTEYSDEYGFDDEINYSPVVGMDEVERIPVDSALLLVYAAEDNGQIIRIQTLDSLIQVSAAGKQFMEKISPRESARWVEALDRLVKWGWVRPTGNKNEIFVLTDTGYNKADWLKDRMGINTEREPLEELKDFE